MRATAIALIVSLITLTAGNAFAQEAGTWRKVAEATPLGSRIRIQMIDGKRVTGTLMRIDDASVMLKKNTRLPEPAVVVNFDRIVNIEREPGGIGWGKAIAIGAAAGVGAILTILVIALQVD